MKMVSVIATSGRKELLERTLWSIERGSKPAGYAGVIVVENGGEKECEEVVAKAEVSFPCQYYHLNEANKSKALNYALSLVEEGLIYFHDDDIVIGKETLQIVYEEAQKGGKGRFFGGPVYVEREVACPSWIEKRLPLSAKGWESPIAELSKGCGWAFLGANWAAWKEDLNRAGLFNEKLGPGTQGVGQDGEMQFRMMEMGVRGNYVPGAIAWHYVPRERSSPEWVLARARRNGYGFHRSGAFHSKIISGIRLMKIVGSVVSGMTLIVIGSIVQNSKVHFEGRYRYSWGQGGLESFVDKWLKCIQ